MKEVVAEAINALNRDKRRVKTTDEGFTSTATDFAQMIRQLESITFLHTTASPRTRRWPSVGMPLGSFRSRLRLIF